MNRYLFIDRDGTLILEPQDEQVDALEKLHFYPEVFKYLELISRDLGYQLVLVSNQDGLGTPSFPRDSFDIVQNKMREVFASQGIQFKEELFDDSFATAPRPNRKPNTGMVKHYLNEELDRSYSFVIGDRWTDMELAANMGIKGIWLTSDVSQESSYNKASCVAMKTRYWREVYNFLLQKREVCVERNTLETHIKVNLFLRNSSTKKTISTGLYFLNHMIEQISKHSGIYIGIEAKGDLQVDEHHTVEDCAWLLGDAFLQWVGDRMGMERYGFVLPMDEALATVAIDLGGRPYLQWDVEFRREYVGDVPTEMFKHFFYTFCMRAQCTLHISCTGENDHHKIESIFKAFGKALGKAMKQNPDSSSIPSTKGCL